MLFRKGGVCYYEEEGARAAEFPVGLEGPGICVDTL